MADGIQRHLYVPDLFSVPAEANTRGKRERFVTEEAVTLSLNPMLVTGLWSRRPAPFQAFDIQG